ncbi:MAG: hypothetical protein H6559_02040 [Lewinellaceae bacterium]|nr:hypothetical protein [Lewinellaceae bacterium]
MGYPNAGSSMHDSRDFGGLEGFFGLLLVDAPCSGEGLFRKSPEAAGEWSEGNVQLCAGRQKRILADAVKLLAPDYLLLYCTCTYNRQENEENARWLRDSFGLCPEPLRIEPGWGIAGSTWDTSFIPIGCAGRGLLPGGFPEDRGQPLQGAQAQEPGTKGIPAGICKNKRRAEKVG